MAEHPLARTAHRDGRLLAAKLAAPLPPPGTVHRPRLTARLDAGPAGRLTVVTGPAGSGKTTLLAGWAAAAGPRRPVAWVTLDGRDSDPARLWSYLLAALCRSGAVPSGSPLAGMGPARHVDRFVITEVAAALEALRRPTTLVLDNAHLLGDGPAAGSLAMLLRHRVPMLHLVVASRGEPPLPLARMRAAGRLTGLDAADLALTPAETARMWALRDLPVSPARIELLAARTRGWAAGLRLAAADPPCVRGDDPALVDYFRHELLAGQPPSTRDFLRRTSVADVLTGELADTLTGRRGGAATLERLRRADLFLHADRCGGYTYHPLFQEFLRHELSVGSADARHLHRTAG